MQLIFVMLCLLNMFVGYMLAAALKSKPENLKINTFCIDHKDKYDCFLQNGNTVFVMEKK